MKQLCTLCHKIHEGSYWKYGEYETVDGLRWGWFCDKWYTPSGSQEFTTEQIKEDRKKYFNSMVQPWRGGVASQEYIDAHGTKNFTKEEIKGAKEVWSDLPGHSTRKKSL